MEFILAEDATPTSPLYRGITMVLPSAQTRTDGTSHGLRHRWPKPNAIAVTEATFFVSPAGPHSGQVRTSPGPSLCI